MNDAAIKIDWPAYWAAFNLAHGGDPVEHNGRWLFRDGWTYALADHSGPEWEPPQDHAELRKLQQAYWAKLRAARNFKYQTLKRNVAQLELAQEKASCKLSVLVKVQDNEGRERIESRPLDLPALRVQVEMLEQDVRQCDGEIEKLKEQGASHGSFGR